MSERTEEAIKFLDHLVSTSKRTREEHVMAQSALEEVVSFIVDHRNCFGEPSDKKETEENAVPA